MTTAKHDARRSANRDAPVHQAQRDHPSEGSPPGKLIVLSGPSGVGKSTVVRRLMQDAGDAVHLSVSATTRGARPGEKDGVDYYFLSPDDFARRRDNGEFLEAVEVFGRGHWYGTLWSEVSTSLEQGKWVLLEIDVDGATRVVERFPDAITLFLTPASAEELERRLRMRGTESEEAIQRRLAVARRELELSWRYQHRVVNVTVDEAVSAICNILRSEGLKI